VQAAMPSEVSAATALRSAGLRAGVVMMLVIVTVPWWDFVKAKTARPGRGVPLSWFTLIVFRRAMP
jgi:hypothetical protein